MKSLVRQKFLLPLYMDYGEKVFLSKSGALLTPIPLYPKKEF